MPGGTSFSDILDAQLHSGRTPAPEPAPSSRPAEVYHLPFVQGWAKQAEVLKPRVGIGPRRVPGPRETTRPAAAAPRASRRTPHRLTPSQQAALRELVACGAELHDDFTADDLRRTFRSLAQRYHPDRHPTAGADEHRRLAETFARVNDGYRLLLKKVS